MNRDRLLKRKQKAVADLEFYDACSEIFALIRDNELEGIHLDRLTVAKKTIRKKELYDTPDEGQFHSWTTIAKENRDGSIHKSLFLTTEEEISFTRAYNSTFRDQIREDIYQRNGKIVEKPKVR